MAEIIWRISKVGAKIILLIMFLATAQIADADLILTLNGRDVTKESVQIEGKENLVITVEGDNENDIDYSVTAEKGCSIEPITNIEPLVENPMDCFLFKFEEEGLGLGVVNLHADDDHIYELVLFYNPETDATFALGIDYDALHWMPPVEDPIEMSSLEIETVEQEPVVPDALQSWRFKPRQESQGKILMTCPSAQVNNTTITSNEIRGSVRTCATTTGGGEMLLGGSVVDITNDITTNTVWTSDNTYHVLNPIDVNGAMLVIEPGTRVDFATGVNAGIRTLSGGVVISKGTAQNPIVFTSDSTAPAYNDYYCPLYITETASTATEMTYTIVEWAYAGVVVLNRSLDKNIENSYFVNCVYGIVEYGLDHTNITNNLFFGSGYGAIEVYMESLSGEASSDSQIYIQNNTCDYSPQWDGITVYGVENQEDAGYILLGNNIVSGNGRYGINLTGNYEPSYMYASILNTGYYNNYANKNREFEEIDPVVATANPYETSASGYAPICYLNQSCDFIDAGSQYIEQTNLIGKTTNFDGLPDKDIVDLGFHHTDWDFVGGEETTGSNIDDLVTMANYWLTYTPYDPNSPNYQDPNIVDPNTISYGGDWNDNGFVDLADLALMAQIWKATPVVPDLQAVITGNPNDGKIELSVSGCNADTQLVYAYINGKYIGQVYALGEAIPRAVDVSESGNWPQEIKFMAIDGCGYFAYTDTTEINYTSPLSYCIVPATYEPDEPIQFAAFNNGAGDATVEVYGDGGQLVWSQNFPGNTISGSIPADYTGIQHTIDNIVFSSASGGFVGKTTYPRVAFKGVDKNIKALLVIPDPKLFLYNPQCRYDIVRAFYDRGIPFARFEASEATWENVAKYGQYGFVKYLYFLGHGNYKYEYGDPNSPTVIYRTRQAFADCTVLSFKASEFETAPSWCVPFPENIERSSPTWASMQFDRLVWVYNDACYGGRLKINGAGNLVEGQAGQFGFVFDGPQSDISLALNIQDTYEPRCYHGWYGPGWFGFLHQTSYQEWGKAVWNWLHDGHNVYETLNHAIDECEDFSADAAVNNYRLKGQGDLTQIRLKK